jgi:hypothetical protein
MLEVAVFIVGLLLGAAIVYGLMLQRVSSLASKLAPSPLWYFLNKVERWWLLHPGRTR